MEESTNARFKQISPEVQGELIATRIEFNYVPNGVHSPEQLTATWWAQYYSQLGGGYQRIGDDGDRMTTVLADHVGETLEVYDPITDQTVELSTVGAVRWLQKWFDYQYNKEKLPVIPEEPEKDYTEE